MLRNASKIFLPLALLLVTVSIVWLASNFTSDIPNLHEQDHSIAEVPIPEGWYTHSLGENIILTRTVQIPDVGATEIYAYGDYILISTGVFDEAFENLEGWNNTRWVFEDEALVKNSQKTKIEGHDALRVEHKATGADGEHLTYFIFPGDRFVSISLYSQSITAYTNEFEQFVHDYIRSLTERL